MSIIQLISAVLGISVLCASGVIALRRQHRQIMRELEEAWSFNHDILMRKVKEFKENDARLRNLPPRP